MKRAPCLYLVLMALVGVFAQTQEKPKEPLRVVQSIPMPDVMGKFDHSAIDVAGSRLFVVAAANRTVEVLDLKTGHWIKRLSGFGKPQGIVFVADENRLLVSDGLKGEARLYRGDTLDLLQTVKLSADADYVNYDPSTKSFYVAHGGADAGKDYGELAVIDVNGKITASIRTAGHPEAFMLEGSGERILVNVPDANHIAVVDRAKASVSTTWPLTAGKKNVPMALDETNKRVFVGCRNGSKMLVVDTTTGKTIASLPSISGADDMFYDAARKRIYLSGGEGFIDVYQQLDADHYRELARVPTGAEAKTSLFVPQLNRLYVAIPKGAKEAELRILEVQ